MRDSKPMFVGVRSVLFTVGYSLMTFVYGLLVIVIWFLPASIRHKIIISWCSLSVKWLRLVCGVRYKVIGADNIKKANGPAVVLSKHQSTWETLMLQCVFFPASTILKKELLNIPFFGWGLRCLQPVGIDRSNPRDALKQVKREGIERLSSGLNLLLFPEGTRIRPGERGKYARSGPEIAISAGVKIIPVAVNAGHCWPIHSMKRYPGLISVVIGEPISTEGKTSREVIGEVEQWIESKMITIESLEKDKH